MPELPEVETVRRGLEPVMTGRRVQDVVVRRRDLRLPVPGDFERKIAGKKIEKLLRRGKYIVVILDDGMGFGLHLGMSGRIKIHSPSDGQNNDQKYAQHDHVIFRVEGGTEIIFNDPRRFGMLFLVDQKWQTEKPFFSMGPEPVETRFSGMQLATRLKNKHVAIKIALLDQAVVAGVGNIYACEALYHAGLSPMRSAGGIPQKNLAKLALSIRQVLMAAIEAGGSTLRDHRKTNGDMGYFQHSFSVYDREGKPCPSCRCDVRKTGGIRRIVQGGRSTFYCPEKQK